MSGDYSTQLDSGNYSNYGDDETYSVDDPYTNPEDAVASPEEEMGETSETAATQTSSYAGADGTDETADTSASYPGIEDFLAEESFSSSDTAEAGAADSLEQSKVITTAHVKHIIINEGDTTIYSIPSKTEGGLVEIDGVSNSGYTRVTQTDASSITFEMIDKDGKVVETVKVNYMQPTADFFIRGGTKLDLSAVENLPIASHIHFGERPKDVASSSTQTLEGNKLYQLDKFRFIGDTNTLNFDGEGTILDLKGDGTATYTITKTKKVDDTHYNFEIEVKNSAGETDTIVLNNVHKSCQINLFGGKLAGDALPEDAQGIFPKNYDAKAETDARIEAQNAKIVAVESGLDDLPLIGKLSREESSKLYQELWQNFKNVVAFYNGNQTQAAAVEGFAKMISRIDGNTNLQTKAGGDATRPLIRNMVKLLGSRYPELLETSCGLNVGGVLGSALIRDTMSKDDIGTLATLEHFTSGATKQDISGMLDAIQGSTSMSAADWNKAKSDGLALFNAYLTSGAYTSYQKDKRAGDLTLTVPVDPAADPSQSA